MRLVGAQIGRDGDEGGRHQAAGAIGGKGQQLADLGRLGRFHLDQDLLGLGRRQLLDDVGGVVGIHGLEQIRGDGGAEGAQDGRGVGGVQLR